MADAPDKVDIKEGIFTKDNITHVLALIIVIGVMVLYTKHLWNYSGDDPKAVEAIGVNLGGIITLVLGYYFGSAVGDKQARTAEKDKTMAKTNMIGDMDEIQKSTQAKLDEIKKLKADLEQIIG